MPNDYQASGVSLFRKPPRPRDVDRVFDRQARDVPRLVVGGTQTRAFAEMIDRLLSLPGGYTGKNQAATEKRKFPGARLTARCKGGTASDNRFMLI